MSRAERRAYQRMTRNQDPMAPPPMAGGARVRQERMRARRAAVAAQRDPTKLFSTRALWWTFAGAFIAGLLGLSVAWPSGPGAAAVAGIGVAVAWVAASIGFLAWRRRSALSAAAQASVSPRDRSRPAAR